MRVLLPLLLFLLGLLRPLTAADGAALVEPLNGPDGKPLPAEIAQYHADLTAARWAAASNSWSNLRGRMTAEKRLQEIWARLAPSNRTQHLVFWRPCQACPDGRCTTCSGRTTCSACAGAGKCVTCKGSGGFGITCQACLCPGCKGTGKCPSCFGSLWRQCKVCGGTGQGAQRTVQVTCSTCKGAGTVQSRIDGSRNTCPTCRGARTLTRTVLGACATCKGSGRQSCPTCQANGICPQCKGLGRKAVCAECRSTGRAVEKCRACQGRGSCPVCQGTALCTICKGKGACSACGGVSAIEVLRLPVPSDWMAVRTGLLRIPEPPPGGPLPRLYKIPVTAGTLNVVSDPAPPAPEASGPILGR